MFQALLCYSGEYSYNNAAEGVQKPPLVQPWTTYFQRKKSETAEDTRNVLPAFSSCPLKCDKRLCGLSLMEQRNTIKSLSGNEGRSRLSEHGEVVFLGKTSDNSIKKAEASTRGQAKVNLSNWSLKQVFA